MRDVTKPIPGLDAEKEKQGGFHRVTADLTKPDTVRDAATTSGAKYAFIYASFTSSDHMKSTIEALKSAGIEQVVLLSSFTVQGDLKATPPSELISYVHTQVELNLQEIFGADGFVAVRPASFASNTLQYKSGFKEGHVKVTFPSAKVDCIVPEDIGRVCGTVLAKGPQDENRAIYLYGPELLSQKETVEIIAERLGQNPKIETTDDEEVALKILIEERGSPEVIARHFIDQHRKLAAGEGDVFGYPLFEENFGNVQKYSGRKPTTFAEWVDQNKDKFIS